MKKNIFTLLMLLNSIALKAQECGCNNNFEDLIGRVSQNYVGYKDKITTSKLTQFNKLTDSLRIASKDILADSLCIKILKNWVSFFKDKHLSVRLSQSNAVVLKTSIIKKIELSEQDIKTEIRRKVWRKKHLEGIWESDDKNYRVGIIKQSNAHNEYEAVVLASKHKNWSVGEVKFHLVKDKNNQFKVDYFRSDKSKREYNGSQNRNVLEIEGSGFWQQIYPKTIRPNNFEAYTKVNQQKINPFQPQLTVINKKYAVISIATFANKPDIDTLLKKYKEILAQIPYIIFDLRGNIGGTNESFENLVPFIYTNPIKIYGTTFLASETNIKLQKEYINKSLGYYSDTQKKEIETYFGYLNEHKGTALRGEDSFYKLDTVLMNPMKVAIITDRKCASSTEHFLLWAKQSQKVTIYGEATAGVVDYGDVRQQKLKCGKFLLNTPTTKFNWVEEKPIDNIGIQPDITIPLKEKDWVKFVIRSMSSANPSLSSK